MTTPFSLTSVGKSSSAETGIVRAFTSTPCSVSTISSLTASRDALAVQRMIREKYGFEPTLQYCSDLVDFVEALTDGQ